MPTLPAITLSQSHYNRVVAAFPGSTAEEKAAAYVAWTQNRLIDRVEQVESNKIDEQASAAKASAMAALAASLPPRQHEPEMP